MLGLYLGGGASIKQLWLGQCEMPKHTEKQWPKPSARALCAPLEVPGTAKTLGLSQATMTALLYQPLMSLLQVSVRWKQDVSPRSRWLMKQCLLEAVLDAPPLEQWGESYRQWPKAVAVGPI